MASTQVNETLVGREVERLFSEISARRGDLCENPVTGGEFVYGFDPMRLQKKIAYHALLAREDFALNGPSTATSFGALGMRAGEMVGQAVGLPHRAIRETHGGPVRRKSASIF
jgi:hypothetical protein